MAVAFVQDWSADTGSTDATSITVTVSGATSGNLLVAIVQNRYSGWQRYRLPVQSEWKPVFMTFHDPSWHNLAIFYREATGDSNDNFTFADSYATQSNRSRAAIVREYSGASTQYPIAGVGNQFVGHGGWTEAEDSASSGLMSPQTGSTAGKVLSILSAQDGDEWITSWTPLHGATGVTAPSGWENVKYSYSSSTSNKVFVGCADKSYDSAGGVNSTWTTSDVGGIDATCVQLFISESETFQWPCGIKHYWDKNITDGQTSVDIVVDSAAAGNLLIASLSRAVTSTNDGLILADSNYEEISRWEASGFCGAHYWREATGDSNDDFNPSWDNGATYGAQVKEFYGIDMTTGLISSALEDSAISTSSGNLTLRSGALVPSVSPSVAISLLTLPQRNDWNSFRLTSVDSDFFLVNCQDTNNNGDPGTLFAIKVIEDTTSTVNPNWRADPAEGFGGQPYGATLLFAPIQPAAAAGGNISINVGGTWKDGTPYINVNDTWTAGTPYINVGGTWEPVV